MNGHSMQTIQYRDSIGLAKLRIRLIAEEEIKCERIPTEGASSYEMDGEVTKTRWLMMADRLEGQML